MKLEFRVFNIQCKVYLLDKVKMIDILNQISHFVDVALCNSEEMKVLHTTNKFKYYSVSGFREIESDKVYKEGKVYSFSVRCIEKELAEYLGRELSKTETKSMKGLVSAYKVIPPLYIEKLYTITPAIVEIGEGGYWRGKIGLEEYERLLFENSIKKYNQIMGAKIEENFKLYDTITFLNKKPIRTNYKSVGLLGDKLELTINSDERAQQIAYMLLATGLGVRNCRSFGYVDYKAIR